MILFNTDKIILVFSLINENFYFKFTLVLFLNCNIINMDKLKQSVVLEEPEKDDENNKCM